MKTAGRENPNRWATLFSNRAPGAGGQNRSCSITWAAKRGNGQPLERCFFLTSTFIERSWKPLSWASERESSPGSQILVLFQVVTNCPFSRLLRAVYRLLEAPNL